MLGISTLAATTDYNVYRIIHERCMPANKAIMTDTWGYR